MRYIISSALASLALTAAAQAEVPRVVTDIPPVHSLVAQVMGDLGAPELLLEQGASEHDFQLRPSQAAGLAEADLVIWIGPELTPWLDRALEGLEGGERLALLASEGTFLRDFAESGAEAEHDHDHDHDHGQMTGEGHDHGDDHAEDHGHSHEGTDPHAWLDPANAAHWAGVIAARLSALDPANAATYAANAQAAAQAIAATDAEVAALLAPVKDRPAIVFHDAYGYLAGHYGLTLAGSIAAGDAAPPGAARLAALRDEAKPVCVFPEAQHDARLAEQLADATGARLGAPLDPVGSTLPAGPSLYGDLMRALGTSLAGCLAG